MLRKPVERDLLQFVVHGEDEVSPPRARRRPKLAHDAPMRVDLVGDAAGLASERRIETLLDAGLAGAEAGKPHDRVFVDLLLVGHADITDDMGEPARMLIVPVGTLVSADTGKLRREHV